ncbi:XRE family transcriptional regulator [Scytonema hofmannii PCC 7110]|uniref:XRE family transcriptional regulator n=1 Tax=Scytonema hofmannii PCC 7110 TaxID=128403 RepID=A0A139WSP2_9CYAN|nr:helix-turn-helix transcriptional regulator [Scytonema hofmannii]KYC35456.1 XRE family transcriptional regulator [Scytonema hofmannii PCC 7110]
MIELKIKLMFKLKEIRNLRGLSQNELARICEMSVTNIQKYEQQKMRSIPFETLTLFCQALNCQPGDLFEKIETLEAN